MCEEANYLILGCGAFGQRAVVKIRATSPFSEIIAVDQDPEKLGKISSLVNHVYQGNALDYLECFSKDNLSCWIVPAAPVHLAYEWLFLTLAKSRRVQKIPVPSDLDLKLLFQQRSQKGSLFLSYANFLCPTDCSEPEGYCSQSGEPRPIPLYQLLEQVEYEGFSSLILKSVQIAPGVGGFQYKKLIELKEKLNKGKGKYLIGTSCRCHAVLDGLYLSPV